MLRAERRRQERQAAREVRQLVNQTRQENHGRFPDCGEKLTGRLGHYPASLIEELVERGLADVHDDHMHLPCREGILFSSVEEDS